MTTVRSLAGALRLALRPGGPSVAERMAALPRLVRATLRGDYPGTTVGQLLMLAGAVGYLLSPLDLAPEMLLGPLGLADDAFVVSWLVKELVAETESFLEWERAAVPRAGAGSSSGGFSAGGSTVRSHVVR